MGSSCLNGENKLWDKTVTDPNFQIWHFYPQFSRQASRHAKNWDFTDKPIPFINKSQKVFYHEYTKYW